VAKKNPFKAAMRQPKPLKGVAAPKAAMTVPVMPNKKMPKMAPMMAMK